MKSKISQAKDTASHNCKYDFICNLEICHGNSGRCKYDFDCFYSMILLVHLILFIVVSFLCVFVSRIIVTIYLRD